MRAAVLLLSLVLATPVSGSREDADRVRGVIERHNANAVRWYAAGDVDSLVSIFAEDAWQMPPNNPALVGREAIRTYWREALAWGKWDFKLQVQKVDVSGPLAVERGKYILKFTAARGRHLACRRSRIAATTWSIGGASPMVNGDKPPTPVSEVPMTAGQPRSPMKRPNDQRQLTAPAQAIGRRT